MDTNDGAVWGLDPEYAQQKLSGDAERLFSQNYDKLEIIKTQYSDNDRETVELSTLQGDDVLPQITRHADIEDAFYIIRQGNSWSRLLIQHSTFERILKVHQVFQYFLATVRAFGHRTKESHDTWSNCHWRLSGKSQEYVEICYTIRYFERNRRNQGDPWSLRQTGIYQQVHIPSRKSVWIVLQPSKRLQRRLTDTLRAASRFHSLQRVRQSLLHLVILSTYLENWSDYISTQTAELEEQEKRSCFSDVDNRNPVDYPLAFSDRQRLHIIRRKLLKASAVVDATCEVGVMLSELIKRVPSLQDINAEPILNELQDCLAEASYHKQHLSSLVVQSSEIASLLSNILQHRMGASSLESLTTMRRIAVQGEADARLAQKDSVTLKCLTVVATVYLPASLLAGVFSSSLVESVNGTFMAAKDFWKFIVILVPFTAGTFLVVAGLKVWWAKVHRRDESLDEEE